MNIFGYILIVVTILLTVFIGIKQPKMHTRLMMYDSQYVLVDENSTPPVETVTKTEELPTMPVENSVSKIKIVMEEQDSPIVKTETNTIEQPKTTTQTQTEVKQNPITKTVTKQVPTTTTTTKPVEKTVTKTIPKTKQTQKSMPVTKTTQNTKQSQQQNTKTNNSQTQQQNQNPIFNTLTQNIPKTTTKVLTAQEEEIAWNVWRSNLQNKIMKDSKMPTLPIGTVFRISFDVDKSGKITNIQTWSPDPKYTPYAIEFIAPVIKSYQGKPILDFPEGSKRTKTSFTGGWKMASTSKYSTPNDYNDIEKVKK